MKRSYLENWISHHPDAIHADAQSLLDRCEIETRDHARKDAWMHAKEIAERSLHRFEERFGYPASDTFVAREVCHEVARELKHHEPRPEGLGTGDWLNQLLLDALDPSARAMLLEWLDELVEQEEHSTWLEIVRFTDQHARTLIREGHLTDQCEWDLDHTYPLVAVGIVKKLIEEFEAHADLATANDEAIMH